MIVCYFFSDFKSWNLRSMQLTLVSVSYIDPHQFSMNPVFPSEIYDSAVQKKIMRRQISQEDKELLIIVLKISIFGFFASFWLFTRCERWASGNRAALPPSVDEYGIPYTCSALPALAAPHNIQGVFLTIPPPELAKCWPVSKRFQKIVRVPDWPPPPHDWKKS